MYMMMVMMMMMIKTTCATLFVCLTSERSTGFQLQLWLAVAKASKRTPIGAFMPSPTLVCSKYSATLPSKFCFFRNWLLRLTVRTLDHLLRHHSLMRLISDSASFECTPVAKSLQPFAGLHVDEERLSSSAAVCVDSQPSETTVEPDLICLPMTFFKLVLPRGFAASGCGSISNATLLVPLPCVFTCFLPHHANPEPSGRSQPFFWDSVLYGFAWLSGDDSRRFFHDASRFHGLLANHPTDLANTTLLNDNMFSRTSNPVDCFGVDICLCSIMIFLLPNEDPLTTDFVGTMKLFLYGFDLHVVLHHDKKVQKGHPTPSSQKRQNWYFCRLPEMFD